MLSMSARQPGFTFLDKIVFIFYIFNHGRSCSSSLFPFTCSIGTNLALESTMTAPALSRQT